MSEQDTLVQQAIALRERQLYEMCPDCEGGPPCRCGVQQNDRMMKILSALAAEPAPSSGEAEQQCLCVLIDGIRSTSGCPVHGRGEAERLAAEAPAVIQDMRLHPAQHPMHEHVRAWIEAAAALLRQQAEENALHLASIQHAVDQIKVERQRAEHAEAELAKLRDKA